MLAAERGYKGMSSPPVPLNLEDLSLDRTQAQNTSMNSASDPQQADVANAKGNSGPSEAAAATEHSDASTLHPRVGELS